MISLTFEKHEGWCAWWRVTSINTAFPLLWHCWVTWARGCIGHCVACIKLCFKPSSWAACRRGGSVIWSVAWKLLGPIWFLFQYHLRTVYHGKICYDDWCWSRDAAHRVEDLSQPLLWLVDALKHETAFAFSATGIRWWVLLIALVIWQRTVFHNLEFTKISHLLRWYNKLNSKNNQQWLIKFLS